MTLLRDLMLADLERGLAIARDGHEVVPAWRVLAPDGDFLILTRFDHRGVGAVECVGRFQRVIVGNQNFEIQRSSHGLTGGEEAKSRCIGAERCDDAIVAEEELDSYFSLILSVMLSLLSTTAR